MKKILKYFVSSIVKKPEKVVIEEKEDDKFINLNVKVDKEDKKIVIGKNGQTIKAIRNLLRIVKKDRIINIQVE